MKRAVFAVVGHPNKGKSSIVATLARNDSIEISQRSGTTDKAFAVKVETANSGYQLVDTPGFQRPTKVLKWLTDHQVSADKRAAVVAKFIHDPDCNQKFPDEVKLLTPIVNGAAILYVVDGSRPFGAEYESEMEILRWTGQPSMALINPIESETHVGDWQNALSQYFKTVRIFNPMKADFEKQIELLQAFSHLNPDWAVTLNQVTADLRQFRELQKKNAALLLARLLDDLCSYRTSQKVLNQSQADVIQPVLAKQYAHWMREREVQTVKELFALFEHFQTQVTIEELDLPPDLFECEHWYMWGLTKQQLATAGAIAGAVAGATADMMVAGHSFMLGALGGGIIGFGSAWMSADKLVTTKLKGLPLGGYEAIYGPIKNKNFPYVVLGRFIYLYQQICQRNHALRGNMEIQSKRLHEQISALESGDQKALHLACSRLIKQKNVDELSSLLLPLL